MAEDDQKEDLQYTELDMLVLSMLATEEEIRLVEGKPPRQLIERQLALAHLIQHRLDESPITDVNQLARYTRELKSHYDARYGPKITQLETELREATEKLAVIGKLAKGYKGSQDGK